MKKIAAAAWICFWAAALALEPGHERCLNNLINVYFISGRIGSARDWLEKADRLKVRVNFELARAVRRAAETPGPGRN